MGAVIDAGCDKIFAICAAISFWSQLWFWSKLLFLIFDSTLGILALILHRAKSRGKYQGQAEIKANWLGKVKYNLQGLTLICLLFNLNESANYILCLANTFAFGSLIRHLNPKK